MHHKGADTLIFDFFNFTYDMMAAKHTRAIWYRDGETVNTELEPELYFFKILSSFFTSKY